MEGQQLWLAIRDSSTHAGPARRLRPSVCREGSRSNLIQGDLGAAVGGSDKAWKSRNLIGKEEMWQCAGT